ncbi:MAG TPA: membrane protein insertase YidC [Caldithrix abyssi]|uniref:Membrane protein insertase YidC n=1 Tax=Caldithrix abyssi TaxID=187145 RepID=A0A7V4TY85_CALAY|nr:membrane protein insertase YidC [Caldithrix abyssi]
MDKKSILALILIAVVIILMPYYQRIIMGDRPQEQQAQVKPDTLVQTTTEKKPVVESKSVNMDESAANKKAARPEQREPKENTVETLVKIKQDSSEKEVTIETDRILVQISNKGGGSLKKYILKKYTKYDSSYVNMISPEIKNNLYLGFQDNTGEFIEANNYLFFTENTIEKKYLKEGERFKIRYTLNIAGGELQKTYIFYNDKYHFDVVVKFSRPNQMLLNNTYRFGWVNGLPSTESYVEDDNNYNQVNIYIGDELEQFNITDKGRTPEVSLTGRADWFAIRTKYFLAAVSNVNANVDDGVYYSGLGIQRQDYVQRLYDVGFNVRETSGGQADTMRIYMGPLDHKELKAYDNNLDLLILNNGWYERTFRFFSLIILQVLEFMHGFIPNYGIVIIIFSILIKLIVYPLTKKSYQSMKEMQKIQPLVQELKEKYKGDPQRMNKEMMKLYKEHGVNPMGGCLPMLLQMPLLFALFIVFRSTIQLRGAMFIPGWIEDLSRSDTLFHLPFSLPFYGNEFNLLPILMAITMIFQSKMTMQDPKQKAMVYAMPVFMLLIFNRFPSGLNLYYTLFNLLTIVQQKFIHTEEKAPDPGLKKKKKK